MSTLGAAIGRRQGKADTDNNGLSRYMLKIEAPAGIKSGNEPDLSLQYSQGTPNGILGYSWALSGVSSIRLGPPKVVYDAVNKLPDGYDIHKPKLILDGNDLLNTKGTYLEVGTEYTTEINNTGLLVTALDESFLVKDNMGRKTEYGSTADSRVTCNNQIVEWRIKRQSDRHGNTINYEYIESPQKAGSTKDVGTSYIDTISYCSNTVTGDPATRLIQFGYEERPDIIQQTSQGGITTWAHRLSSISIGSQPNAGKDPIFYRSYSMSYDSSATTGDSCLLQVTESSSANGQKVDLLPSSFTYTVPGVDPGKLFEAKVDTSAFTDVKLSIGTVPLNLSGRALADLAFMDWDQASMMLTVRTYIAERQQGQKAVTWTPSAANVNVKLPKLDVSAELPSFLTPDLGGDGRSDLIIPFQNDSGELEFFSSQSNGLGLTDTQQHKTTDFAWVAESRFMAMDMSGTGVVDVVQIFNDQGKLCFRNFPGLLDKDSKIGLGDAYETKTNYDFDNTIDWFLLRHAGTGEASLVRAWQQFNADSTKYVINTTAFRCAKVFNSSGGFEPVGEESTITDEIDKGNGSSPAWSVMSCDINGDGAQDIVLGKVEHKDSKVNFTFIVALANGMGGFTKGSPQTLAPFPGPAPKDKGPAAFSVSNIHGGLYPSLAYVYQRADNGDITCLSVGGRAGGVVSAVEEFPVAQDPKFDSPRVIPVDLNGTGMGGWILNSIAAPTQQLVSVYNNSQPTDLLASSDDPMGIHTALSYGSLSDPGVYDSGIEGQSGNTRSTDYGLQGAPNHVVTELHHTNNPDINFLPFDVQITKTYKAARINSVGRGWLGFESILTTNATDGILTVEHFFQEFPKTGLKCKIDTYPVVNTQMDHPSSSKMIDYKPVPVKKDTDVWTIYHVDKILDKVETAGPTGRVQTTDFTVDDNSNITTKHYQETQAGATVFESWERCTYETVQGFTGLLKTKKLTGSKDNQDATKFEAGDVSFTEYAYDQNTGNMVSESDWFDTMGKFLVTTYEFDQYGNEKMSLDPAGLKTETIYDPTFHNLVLERTETAKNINITELMAYDQASGEVVAHLESNGRLTCTKLDGFGRKLETRLESINSGAKSQPAKDFLSQTSFVSTAEFEGLLNRKDTLLDPNEQYSYNRFKSGGQKNYITSITLSYYNAQDNGQTEVLEAIDCVGQRKMQRTRQGTDPGKTPAPADTHVSWNYWDYDSRGNTKFESFAIPSSTAKWDDFEYQPNQHTEGTISAFDELGRVISATRPGHDNVNLRVSTVLTYGNGGGIVTELVTGPSPNASDKEVQMWDAPRTYVSIDGKEHVTSSTNQDNMTTAFQYDVAGNVTIATDPKGNVETRTYNSLGQLRTMDNVYQRGFQAGGPAMQYEYDGAGQLVKTTSSSGEVIGFTRDAKNRPLQKTGADGRVLVYTYDEGGHENLSSMSVYPEGVKKHLETRLDFDYDILARLLKRTLMLADGTPQETSFAYDWQDQPVKKVYPSGAQKNNEYFGNLLSYTKITNEPASGHLETYLDSRFEYTGNTNKPSAIMVGNASTKATFIHSLSYDLQTYPLERQLDTKDPSTGQNVSLVHEKYKYTGADQIAQLNQVLTNTTTLYNYDGKRLSNSQIGGGPVKEYKYDEAGNLTTKGDTTISYTNNVVQGRGDGGYAFEVTYDKAGRMVSRDNQKTTMNFTYDSFGLMRSYTDTLNQTTTITSGPDGKTVLRKQVQSNKSLLIVSDDYHVQTLPDGTKITTFKLFGSGVLLGSYSNAAPPASVSRGSRADADNRAVVYFTDHKGSVTHTFAGINGQLLETITYDDFGSPVVKTIQQPPTPSARTSTYEAKAWDATSGLLDFSSRWYDPLIGRFASPDNILDTAALARTDGLNRLAFENNDPVNKNDPTGHWSLSAIFGAVLGGLAVVGAIALTIATAGAATPVAAAAVGALASGGIAGITYSFDHQNERGGKFWAGYAATVIVNAAVGAAAGYLGAVATPARLVSATGRLSQGASWGLSNSAVNFVGKAAAVGSNSLVGATSALVKTVAHNAVENIVYGAGNGLFDGAGTAALTGGLAGAASAAWSARSVTYAARTTWSFPAGRTSGVPGKVLQTGWAVAKGFGLDKKAEQKGKDVYHEQQTKFRALEQMVGKSGLVGSLQVELQRNTLYVNYS
ncbi:hypothetical protein SLS64_011587 [Diaporthe eres]|uniref:Insecticide toxin TcdB middle/N-terminal domain-containing protein n=1 Tax=Diaporthe eres TaxID=83184 RepID=A0ABR1NN24_DIAER